MKNLAKHLLIYFSLYILISVIFTIRSIYLGESLLESILIGVFTSIYIYTLLSPLIILIEIILIFWKVFNSKKKDVSQTSSSNLSKDNKPKNTDRQFPKDHITPSDLQPVNNINIKTNRIVELINSTRKAVIEIIASPTRSINITQSKYFGLPYFLKSQKAMYPRDSETIPMKLIAQINLSDIKTSSGLPKTGLLQFYISQQFYNLQEGNVIYHNNIVEDKELLISDFHFLQEESADIYANELFPSAQEFSLKFHEDFENITFSDFKFMELISNSDLDKYDWDDNKALEREGIILPKEKHKLFGYPNFTQEDPRLSNEHIKDYFLLFQMKSHGITDKGDINWNDQGFCNFFIDPDDLKRLDFSKVYFYSD